MRMFHQIPRKHARLDPDFECLVFEEHRLTWKELNERVDRLVAGLLSLGVKPGEHVAILAQNSHRFVEYYYACSRAGFVAVPLNGEDGADSTDRKYLAATHGKDELLLDELIRGEQYRYVCHGHTHRMSDHRINSTRVLNPGALYHPRGGSGRTAMLLDTDTDTVKIMSVE